MLLDRVHQRCLHWWITSPNSTTSPNLKPAASSQQSARTIQVSNPTFFRCRILICDESAKKKQQKNPTSLSISFNPSLMEGFREKCINNMNVPCSSVYTELLVRMLLLTSLSKQFDKIEILKRIVVTFVFLCIFYVYFYPEGLRN